jgi:hypothetical protein
MNLTLEQGKKLVKLARSAIFSVVVEIDGFEEKRGVFVTLNSYPSGELRGCIGFTEPIYKLKDGVVNAARHAALRDTRFMPVNSDEKVIIEVSVLTEPELIKVDDTEEYFDNIEIGKDGLIVEFEGKKGLLLPQVFLEWKADVKKALQMTCQKAELVSDTWKNKDCKVYKFQSQIFTEKKPKGDIYEKVK